MSGIGIGHNRGPSMEPGHRWRRHAWTKARAALIPKTMPLEIVRLRVARAKALGLDYQTYAQVRATTGQDIVAFLFSGNALRLGPRQAVVPAPEQIRLVELDGIAGRLAAVYAPLHPESVAAANKTVLDHVSVAPDLTQSWSATRGTLQDSLRAAGLSPSGVVLVPATTLEQDWCAAAKLGGMIQRDRFFPGA